MIAPLPVTEAERLAVLDEHRILDTPPTKEFDDLVRLAAHICGVPIAAVSLIDEHRQWFKAITGLDATQTPRDVAFCAHTILESDLMVVPDAQTDPRFADNPLVTGDPHIRFYAGVPLVTEDGYALGTVCVIDRIPRQLMPAQQSALRALGRQARVLLEMGRRLAHQERLVAEQERLIAERVAALAESQRLAAIVASSADAIISTDLEGSIVSWNTGAEHLYGYTAAEMIGQNESVLVPPGETSFHANTLLSVLQDGRVEGLDVVRRHKNGSSIKISLTLSLIREGAGQAIGISAVGRDITVRLRQEQALREIAERLRQSEAGLRALLESAPVILYAADTNGMVTLSEGTGLTALGLTPGEAVGRSVFEFSGGDPALEAPTRRALAGEPVSYDAHLGSLCLHTELRPVRDGSGAVTGLIGVCFDVTERARAEERFRVLFEESSDAHLLLGEGGIIDCNPAAVRMLRCTDINQLLSLHPAILSPEFQLDGRRSDEKCLEMDALAHERGYHRFEWTHRKMDGEDFPVEVTLTPVTLGNRPVLLVVWHDLTERKRAEEQVQDYAVVLEHQRDQLERTNAELEQVNAQLEDANARLEELATRDGLTGLKNHRAFQEHLEEHASLAARHGTPLSLVLLDVDHFKQYNDSFGHLAGDEVLRTVASDLLGNARDGDLVARYGGEEFVLVLPHTDQDGALAVAERLRASLETHSWPSRGVTASIGVSTQHPGDRSSADLIARADAAMYCSKKRGRNRVTSDCATSDDSERTSKSRLTVIFGVDH